MAVVAQQLGARVAGHVLHDDEVLVLALVEAEVEHLDDVGVHEAGGRQRLAPEARHEGRIVGQMLGQQLDRDVALQPLVEGELDRGHAADAEAALDAVSPGDRRCACHVQYPPSGRPPRPPPMPAPPLPVEVVPVPVDVVAGAGWSSSGPASWSWSSACSSWSVYSGLSAWSVGVEGVVVVPWWWSSWSLELVDPVGQDCWTSARRLWAPCARHCSSAASTPGQAAGRVLKVAGRTDGGRAVMRRQSGGHRVQLGVECAPLVADSRLPLLPQAASNDTATPE